MTYGLQKNYFELFGLEIDFDVDPADLVTRYRTLQKETHPDKFASSLDQEKRLAMQLTAHANEALRVLKDPLQRARYMLGLRGYDQNDDTDTSMDPKFLMAQMEYREALESVKDQPNPHKHLLELVNALNHESDDRISLLRAHLAEHSEEGDQQARGIVKELQFFSKLIDQAERIEEEIM